MSNIIQKVFYHMSERFMRHHIFLPAVMTEFSLYNSTTVKAIFLSPLGYMRHLEIFLKNKYKLYRNTFFFVTNN